MQTLYSNTIDDRMCDFKSFYDWAAKDLPQICKVVEVGNADGFSAIYLAEKLSEYGKNFRLYMVDNMGYGGYNQMKTLYENIYYSDFFEQIEIIPADSVKASKMFNGDSLDFVFLDSSHTYGSTIREIKAWYPKLKDQSILSGHDYLSEENTGVRKAVDELLPQTIKRKTIDNKKLGHYQEFAPEQLLHTFDTTKNLGVWYCRKRFYFKP